MSIEYKHTLSEENLTPLKELESDIKEQNLPVVDTIYDDIPLGLSQHLITEIYNVENKILGRGAYGEVKECSLKKHSLKKFSVKTIQNTK